MTPPRRHKSEIRACIHVILLKVTYIINIFYYIQATRFHKSKFCLLFFPIIFAGIFAKTIIQLSNNINGKIMFKKIND